MKNLKEMVQNDEYEDSDESGSDEELGKSTIKIMAGTTGKPVERSAKHQSEKKQKPD